MKIGIVGDLSLSYPNERIDNVQKIISDYKISTALSVLEKNDYNIVNLECPITDSTSVIKKLGPSLKNPKEIIEFLNISNINVTSLANNHIYDFGKQGIIDTLTICQQNDIKTVGAGNLEENINTPLFLSSEDIKVAVIACAENEFNTIDLDSNKWGSNNSDIIDIYEQIKFAKQNSNHIILIFHGGHEQYSYPSLRIKKLYHFFVDLGVDAVVAHHPHVVQGIEVYKNKPIFYSLGNYFFPSEEKIKTNHEGIIVNFNFTENTFNYDVIPYQQCLTDYSVNLFGDTELTNFLEELNSLSEVIKSDTLLKNKWNDLVKSKSSTYFKTLSPFSNRINRIILKFGLQNIVFKEKFYLRLLNYIRCESHRDAFINFVKQELNGKL